MKPSIGRIVHYTNSDGLAQAALVIHVWSDTCVNLVTWNQNGTSSTLTSVLSGAEPGQWKWPERV